MSIIINKKTAPINYQYKYEIDGQNICEVISMGSKLKINKKENKNISHNPQAESVKACFGEPKAKKYDPTDFKI